MKSLTRLTAMASAMVLSVSAVAAERAMIILDGSGSMWGQIDGTPKLEIARQALRDVLESTSPSLELGLMAYGHREKGNCADIEILVEPAANNKKAITAAADQMKFLGKTPISAAVRQAAENLRYTEEKATVILITDGEETCQADPCALGAELAKLGVDFTAHVVGFDLTQKEGEQVACLAEKTGGQYFAANDADALKKAMTMTVAAVSQVPVPVVPEPEPEPEEVPQAVEADPEPEPVKPVLPDASIKAPASATAGTVIQVAWTGPGERDDYIAVAAPDAKPDAQEVYVRINRGNPLKIQLPDRLGTYQIRYLLQSPRTVLATQDIELTAVEATVKGPDTAGAGSVIEVDWVGPNSPDDYILVIDQGAPDSEYINYTRTSSGQPVRLTMPDEVGNYEIRYVLNSSKRVLASQPITLTGVTATLELQNKPVPGGHISVAWTGPNNRDDYITVVPKGAAQDAYLGYVRTSGGPLLKLKAPKEPGAYELRYVVNQSKRVLMSIPLALADAAASVSVPASVQPGTTLQVEWTGPGNREDFIEIVAADAAADAKPMAATRTSQGSPLSIFAPAIPGQYVVRYIMRDTKEVVASASLTVE